MEASEFRRCGKELIDFIADYLESLDKREPAPRVLPNYLRECLPRDPPQAPEDWDRVLEDVDAHILRGTTHWLHPRFNAYFPIGISYPAILGDLLSSCFGVGFTWRANPALTELERLVLDWLADMTGMPLHFRNDSGTGGGSLQGSASDCVLVSMLAARKSRLGNSLKELPLLVAYCSELAHSCVDKAAQLACVRLRKLPFDNEDFSLCCDSLEAAIQEDRRQGLVPFYVCAVLGTTACASCDNIEQIGTLCQREGLWCHVDAAYAGSALICEEFRHFSRGVELVDSFNFNPSKWLLCTFDSSVLWVKDCEQLRRAMAAGPATEETAKPDRPLEICDLKDWGVPLSRRFRALKVWFVIRLYGVKQLQQHIRRHCQLAQLFRSKLQEDERFQIIAKTNFSLVCFRFRQSNALSRLLVCRINESRELYLMPASLGSLYAIRFAVVRERASAEDVEAALAIVRRHADRLDSMIAGGARYDDVINTKLTEEDPNAFDGASGRKYEEPNYLRSDDLIVGLSDEQLKQKWEHMLLLLRQEELHRD